MKRRAQVAGLVGGLIDPAGVVVIAAGKLVAAAAFVVDPVRPPGARSRVPRVTASLGRAILLGLEFLVAANIIRTVPVAPILQSVAVLGLIVLVRTFLRFALEIELEGMPPWRRANMRNAPADA